MVNRPRIRLKRTKKTTDGTLLVLAEALLTKTKSYATLDINVFGDSAYSCCLWIHGDSRRGGFDRENYLLHIPGVFRDLSDHRCVPEVGLTPGVEENTSKNAVADCIFFISLRVASLPSSPVPPWRRRVQLLPA